MSKSAGSSSMTRILVLAAVDVVFSVIVVMLFCRLFAPLPGRAFGRDGDVERRADVLVRPEPHPASMQFDQFLGDEEPQADSLDVVLDDVAAAVERGEDAG